MNEVFLIGKIITNIEFKFMINSKNISIAKFEIEIISNKQTISLKAYDEIADFVYSSFSKNDIVMINGYLDNNGEVITKIISKF